MLDEETERRRRIRWVEINAAPRSREQLEKEEGRVWDTEAMRADFEVLGYAAPLVVVKRRSDGALGSLEFQHDPRWYFGWQPHEKETPGDSK